jgi:hypothetical protein
VFNENKQNPEVKVEEETVLTLPLTSQPEINGGMS